MKKYLFTGLLIIFISGCSSEFENNAKNINAFNTYANDCINDKQESCQALGIEYGDNNLKNINDFISLVKDKCDTKKEATSCYIAGLTYYNLDDTGEDKRNAFDYYKEGCDLGDVKSCDARGTMYRYGQGGQYDLRRAREYFKKACELNNMESCYRVSDVGLPYPASDDEREVFNKEKERFYKKALSTYEKQCDAKDALNCFKAGYTYQYKLVGQKQQAEKYYAKALDLLQTACDAKETKSCRFIAEMYYRGIGVQKSYERLAEYNKKACDLNDVIACFQIAANPSRNGIDKKEALEYYKKSCDLKSIKGCYEVADTYSSKYSFSRYGVQQDYKQALEYYKKGCDLGGAHECFNAGMIYSLGHGTPVDASKAFPFYKQACDISNCVGCWETKEGYYKGEGIQKDEQKAQEYQNKRTELKCNRYNKISSQERYRYGRSLLDGIFK